jgi:O-antigen/teichoic acid export membrane protein
VTSIRSRFVFTLAANLGRSFLSLITGLLLARWLSPENYGRMAFLLGTFLAVRQLLDMGASTAFFTFMSQKPRTRRFVRVYVGWLLLQVIVAIVLISVLMPAAWIEFIWRGESRGLVMLAFLAVFMQNSMWPAIQAAGEAHRNTFRVQGAGVGVAAMHLAAVALLWWADMLGIAAILVAIVAEHFVALLAVRGAIIFAADDAEEPPTGAGLFRKYLVFCLPFIPYAWVGFSYDFADRWLLQRFGGSSQQAFYAVSAQFASIALLATSSILAIFWKEVAEAHYRGDRARAGMLYQRVSRMLFFVGAALAGYFTFWTSELVHVLLGDAYANATLTLSLMFLLPVHQSMGQIGDTLLFATERGRLQTTVGIFFMLASIGVTYALLAPHVGPFDGPQLGASGVAIKMLVLQFLRVNVVMLVICRLFDWRVDWVYQPASLGGCLILGWLAHSAVVQFSDDGSSAIAMMASGAVIYGTFIALLLLSWPRLTGFSRADLAGEISGAWRQFRRGSE